MAFQLNCAPHSARRVECFGFPRPLLQATLLLLQLRGQRGPGPYVPGIGGHLQREGKANFIPINQ